LLRLFYTKDERKVNVLYAFTHRVFKSGVLAKRRKYIYRFHSKYFVLFKPSFHYCV